MTNVKDRYNATLALRVGQTKRLYDAGLSAVEIAEKLGHPESSVRAWIQIIEEAKENQEKMDEAEL